jgi:hypothetical protein
MLSVGITIKSKRFSSIFTLEKMEYTMQNSYLLCLGNYKLKHSSKKLKCNPILFAVTFFNISSESSSHEKYTTLPHTKQHFFGNKFFIVISFYLFILMLILIRDICDICDIGDLRNYNLPDSRCTPCRQN